MILRPRCLSEEDEGKAEETKEEEAEAKTEVEGTSFHIHMEGATVKVTATAKTTTRRMLKDRGMINPMFNITIVRNIVIMLINVDRISKI